jgi:hypothetical protein
MAEMWTSDILKVVGLRAAIGYYYSSYVCVRCRLRLSMAGGEKAAKGI